ncbi:MULTISPECIES: hypothetical protein [unclassified Variovorax]|uniref:hypothetical protein n=1 Tax=unclassified Variovorax TaxID=663243 RepID=UPI000D12C8F7|nr:MULTISPECIES: hypothetical protein [unclassified Variovorax]AVQ80897.1 hypothetical protein C4F17_08015 [Variovorax sp. PMC12]QRY29714.1 hypothetical protein JVX96_16490 [Variovorax sp. PDNC026]
MKKLGIALLAAACSMAHAVGWNYDSSTDKMTGKKSASAQTVSDNSLSFGFPYQGVNRGNLIVRQHPQYGLDVLITIDKGQMLCSSYDCKVSIKFDDAPPVKFSGSGPADHSSQTIFIEGAAKFIASAKKAKKILVQFNAYQNGAPVLEFSTPQPLDWPKK